jgi:hypothetical protein
MRKAWRLFLVALSALALAGCISVETTVELNRDGSGKIIEKIGVGKEMAGMAASMAGEGGGAKPFSREQFADDAKRFGEGVRFVSVDESQGATMMYYTIVYAFDDISKIAIDQNQGNAMPSGGGPGGEKKEEPMRFEFSAGEDSSTLTIRMPEREDDFGDEEVDEVDIPDEMEVSPEMEQAGAAMMKMMFKGMHFAVRIDFNGDIVETDATNVDGNTVTLLEMDFEAIMDDAEKLAELNTKQPKGIEEVKELLKDVEGLKFEFQEEVEVEFE